MRNDLIISKFFTFLLKNKKFSCATFLLECATISQSEQQAEYPNQKHHHSLLLGSSSSISLSYQEFYRLKKFSKLNKLNIEHFQWMIHFFKPKIHSNHTLSFSKNQKHIREKIWSVLDEYYECLKSQKLLNDRQLTPLNERYHEKVDVIREEFGCYMSVDSTCTPVEKPKCGKKRRKLWNIMQL
ncbi:hypothetical protein ACTFIW_003381 [Dictyostelium discoideum]